VHPAIGPALLTLLSSLAMALYVLVRRHKEPLHWMLLGKLAGIMLWTGGVVARYSVTTPEALAVSVRVILTGVLLASVFWLLTALAYAGERAVRARGNVAIGVLMVSALFALALFTNDGHRLFLRKVDFPSVQAGPGAYVGPVFWVYLAWCYASVGVGMGLYLNVARTMLRADARRRGLALATASAVPPVLSTLFVFQLVPLSYDLTPIGLMVSMLLLSVAVFRYQLLESLPLARAAVLEHLDDGVVMASASGRITQWNPAAVRILGDRALRRGGDLVRTLADALGADPAALGREQAASVRTADGRVIEVVSAAVEEGRGEPSGRFAIVSDRSAIDRAEQLARRTQRLEIVGALAGEVALQINDPLTYVRSALIEIERMGQRVAVERDGADAALAAELADLRDVALETLEGVERIRRIVVNMGALSNQVRGGDTEVDLNEVARSALRAAQLGDENGDAPPVILDLGALPSVRGNADRLAQVVLNLLVNARQALGRTAGARIHVATRASEAEVELEVRDNGPGIAEDVLDRVFDPFFTTRAPDEGTGLGLAIAFDIAREHGGALEVRSRPGHGACFVLRLPVLGAERSAHTGAGREMGAQVQ
jgi:two-component system sensor histidine kinase HupT/HoxJ